MSENVSRNGVVETGTELSLGQRLREEITILRIEGTLFCYDPKEAKRRTGIVRNTLKDADGTERPVSIEIHPTYGQPSVLAYKIVQAIFLKMTEVGAPYPNVIAFTQRELARLVGRAWAGATSRELYHAMMQLQKTSISCSVHNKETKEHIEVNFAFFSATLFSSKDKSISECVVQVNDIIVNSLNKNHAIWINYDKLSQLDTISMALYKRLFFHFSNTYHTRKARADLQIAKDYQDICREWLGGLKPEKYKSRIVKQLGRYLDEVCSTGLIRGYEIVPRADGTRFKIVFYPGEGFFDDYVNFYVRSPRITAQEAIGQRDSIDPRPLQLVAYFHELLGHPHNKFEEKEKAQAAQLLQVYSEEEVRALIEYVVQKAKSSNYPIQFFGAVLKQKEIWVATHAAASCQVCNGKGWFQVSDAEGTRMRKCSHGRKPH